MTHSFPTRRSSDLWQGGERKPRLVLILRPHETRVQRREGRARLARDRRARRGQRDLVRMANKQVEPRLPFELADMITDRGRGGAKLLRRLGEAFEDRKSTRLNSSH